MQAPAKDTPKILVLPNTFVSSSPMNGAEGLQQGEKAVGLTLGGTRGQTQSGSSGPFIPSDRRVPICAIAGPGVGRRYDTLGSDILAP